MTHGLPALSLCGSMLNWQMSVLALPLIFQLHTVSGIFHVHRHDMSRPATHPDLIGISRFFSTNLGVYRFPDSTMFLFRFKIGKTKRAPHFVA